MDIWVSDFCRPFRTWKWRCSGAVFSKTCQAFAQPCPTQSTWGRTFRTMQWVQPLIAKIFQTLSGYAGCKLLQVVHVKALYIFYDLLAFTKVATSRTWKLERLWRLRSTEHCRAYRVNVAVCCLWVVKLSLSCNKLGYWDVVCCHTIVTVAWQISLYHIVSYCTSVPWSFHDLHCPAGTVEPGSQWFDQGHHVCCTWAWWNHREWIIVVGCCWHMGRKHWQQMHALSLLFLGRKVT